MTTRPGYLITLSGNDGTGKSTLAARLQAYLLAEHGLRSEPVWCKFGIHPLSRFGLSRTVRRDSQPTPAHTPQQTLAARVYCRALLLFHFARLRSVARRLARERIVIIADRYSYDTIVDLQQAFGCSQAQARHIMDKNWIRQPDACFLLDLPPEIAYQRKTDTASVGFLEQRRAMYQALAAVYPLKVLDAAQSPDAVFQAAVLHLKETINHE